MLYNHLGLVVFTSLISTFTLVSPGYAQNVIIIGEPNILQQPSTIAVPSPSLTVITVDKPLSISIPVPVIVTETIQVLPSEKIDAPIVPTPPIKIAVIPIIETVVVPTTPPIVTPIAPEPKIETISSDDVDVRIYGINFAFDQATLLPKAMQHIESLAQTLKNSSSSRIVIEGHTDNKGSPAYNLALSQRRANAVVDELVATHGISRSRLVPIGRGLENPIAPNDSPEGRALNRRVDVKIQ